MPNIYYGIAGDISRKIDNWINIAGAPDVFSEKDENLHNYQTKLLGKYDVVSLDEALMRYPDADVWVTYRKANNTARILSKKVPPENIHFLEADLEYRKGCQYLGNFISYRINNFSPCCITGKCPIVRTSGSISERLAQWQDYTTNLIDDIRCGRPNDCQSCHMLKYGFWRKSVRLNEMNFGANQPGDICNFRCVYCFCERTLRSLNNDNDGFTTYEIIKQLSKMPEYDTDDFTVQIANGEFCASKHCDNILDILLQTKWKIELLSNFSIYKEKLATLMSTGRITRAVVSIDAGTRETFEKIKRADKFERVVENLRNYPVDKTKLKVKYIFLKDLNDNESDIDGFYKIVKEIGGNIVLSADTNTPYTEKMRELTLRIIKKAKADGINVDSTSAYLCPQDARFIRESYSNA